ncbi:MAG: VOC family protein [Bacteroidetes bacterium]|nr:VOC family protein [Bacteroidota bacterium]MCB0603714.1 VOC family protein [Saprospiraceae bacterium]MCO5278381.1 VOC family protein [Saprospiraceae bacterium]
MKPYISGIQQIGIGVSDVHQAWDWYNRAFGMDVPVFEEAATAGLMLPYTGGKPQDRHAILALNLRGGGGFEIWQYTSRTPEKAKFNVVAGDLGIFIAKIKTSNIKKAFSHLIECGAVLLSEAKTSLNGMPHFYVKDPYDNIFEIIEQKDWFSSGPGLFGGCCGAVIGVTDIEKSKLFYKTILGYDTIKGETEVVDDEWKNIPGGDKKFKRVVLTHEVVRKGPFSELLGYSSVELIQALDYEPTKIFKDRYWGDLGYIHLCFDIQGMDEMRQLCTQMGYPFTVDSSNSFDMGEAAGHFSYIEDPDGSLIEFVETHKIPIIKKVGWYLNLKTRQPDRPLPRWMLKALRFSRRKLA